MLSVAWICKRLDMHVSVLFHSSVLSLGWAWVSPTLASWTRAVSVDLSVCMSMYVCIYVCMYVFILHSCNLRICAISRLRCAFPDPEIAHYSYVISRLRNTFARSWDCATIVCNFDVHVQKPSLGLREATKKWRLCVVLIHCVNSRVQATIVWLVDAQLNQ